MPLYASTTVTLTKTSTTKGTTTVTSFLTVTAVNNYGRRLVAVRDVQDSVPSADTLPKGASFRQLEERSVEIKEAAEASGSRDEI